MATPFSFEIVTPDKMLFTSEEVTYVGFRALSGNLGLKARHMPIIATMDIAPMKLEFTDGSVKEFAVCGGFLEMKDNKCTVLATIAEADADIDTARATAAKERAEQRLASKSEALRQCQKNYPRPSGRGFLLCNLKLPFLLIGNYFSECS